MQTTIPAMMIRGGTSKGLYFLADDLPPAGPARDKALIAAMGAHDPDQIDGLGGATPVTSKVAIVSKSADSDIDIDYLFAQVGIGTGTVDYGPTCGNILSGVGPFAIESGLVDSQDGETSIRIRLVNTGGRVVARVPTPGGQVDYGMSSGVEVGLTLTDIAGGKTGAMFPTGNRTDTIDGVDVSLIDVAMPMMLLDAKDVGLEGDEDAAFFESHPGLMARLEALRLEAGLRMGLGDVRGKVIPKIGILSAPRNGGSITSRYLVPDRLHPAHALTGAICVATAAALAGTVADGLAELAEGAPTEIEHPSGSIALRLDLHEDGGAAPAPRAEITRTARLLFAGSIMIPELREAA